MDTNRMKILCYFVLCFAAMPCYAGTIPLTGTIRTPQGTLLNGRVDLSLSYSAARDTSANNIIVASKVSFPVRNGALPANAQIAPNDVLQPRNTTYLAEYFTSAGSKIGQNNFYIAGASFNLGAALPTTITTSNISFIAPVQIAGGGSFTSGRIPYTVDAQSLADTANLTWSNSTQLLTIAGTTPRLRVGGTAEPNIAVLAAAPIAHFIAQNSAAQIVLVDTFATNSNFECRRANGTLTSPSAIAAGQTLCNVGGSGYDGTTYTGIKSDITFVATENWTASKHGAGVNIFATSVGTATPEAYMTVGSATDNVAILGNAVKVTDNSSFNLGYPLLHLMAADNAPQVIAVDSYGTNSGLVFRRANGTAASPSAVLLDQALGQLVGAGFGATHYFGGKGAYELAAAENWTDSATGTYARIFTTPKASTTARETARFDSTGNTFLYPHTGLGNFSIGTSAVFTGPQGFIGATNTTNGNFVQIGGDGTTVYSLRSGKVGSGTELPLETVVGTTVVTRWATSGNDRTCIYINGSLRVLSVMGGAVIDGGACP